MATHSSVLAWRIPQTEGPGGLQSTGSKRVGHDGATKQQPTCKDDWVTSAAQVRKRHRGDLRVIFLFQGLATC